MLLPLRARNLLCYWRWYGPLSGRNRDHSREAFDSSSNLCPQSPVDEPTEAGYCSCSTRISLLSLPTMIISTTHQTSADSYSFPCWFRQRIALAGVWREAGRLPLKPWAALSKLRISLYYLRDPNGTSLCCLVKLCCFNAQPEGLAKDLNKHSWKLVRNSDVHSFAALNN